MTDTETVRRVREVVEVWDNCNGLDSTDAVERIAAILQSGGVDASQQGEAVAPSKGMTIARALREGLRAEVWLSGGTGPVACVGICGIQLQGWTHTAESAKTWANGYNRGIDDMRSTLAAAQAPAEDGEYGIDGHVVPGKEAYRLTSHAGECDRAPMGWFCTRAKGHKGPCAAVELIGTNKEWCAAHPGSAAYIINTLARQIDAAAAQAAHGTLSGPNLMELADQWAERLETNTAGNGATRTWITFSAERLGHFVDSYVAALTRKPAK